LRGVRRILDRATRQLALARSASVLAALIAIDALASPAVSQLPPSIGSPGSSATPVRTEPLTERERAVHLLSRATYGVRPADVDELLGVGADAWLDAQMHPETIGDEALDSIRRVPVLAPSRIPLVDTPSMTEMAPPAPPRRFIARDTEALTKDKLLRAIHSRRQLEEVMTDFWFNHFNVSLTKQGLRSLGLVPHYERTVIRPHVFGRFEEMLLAVAQHPAMLVYLDNYLNTTPGPSAPGGGGINENYARELLELHTLGVDGGYTQQDVIEVARAFTGWSTMMPTRPTPATRTLVPVTYGMLQFFTEWHDPETKVVLGHTLGADRGVEDGRDVIALLARHPSTARHVATKLARHFVADEPPADLIDELARVFLETDGDLRKMTRALFTSEAFFRPEHYRAKVKRPFELVASTLRLTNARPASPPVVYLLEDLLHLPYSEPAPTGYPTTADEWMGAGALLSRANFGLDLAAGQYVEAPIDPMVLLGATDGSLGAPGQSPPGGEPPDPRAITRRLIARLFVGHESPSLEESTVRHLEQLNGSDLSALVARALGLLIGSPDFQRY
jgi:uncharacterized protein (DUF1800 family)